MELVRQAPVTTLIALAIFTVAALLLATMSGGNLDRVILRLVIEVPLLLIMAGICLLIINLIAAGAGSLFGGSVLVAAGIAAMIAWAISGGYSSSSSFAGLGFHAALQPAFAVAVALPWLLRSNVGSVMSGWLK